MKKFVCLLLLTALVLSCATVGFATLTAEYRDGKIYVTNSGQGMTRLNTGDYLDQNHRTVVITPPAGATSYTVTGSADPFFGGDGGSVTVQIGGGSTTPSTPTQPPVNNPTQPPVNVPTQPPVNNPTQAPGNPSNPPAPAGSVSVSNYVNGTVTVTVSGITTPSAIYIDGIPTGITIDGTGSRAVKVGNLNPGTHTVEAISFTGSLYGSFTVSSQPAPTQTPSVHVHSWSGWNTVKNSTCEGAGEETRTCLICGETETKRLSPLGHRYVVESENDRYTNYRCSNCGKHMQKEKPVYATPVPAQAPLATMSPNLATSAPASTGTGLSAVERNKYGHILWDSSAMSVDYDAYADVQDASTVVIEVAQDTRAGKVTEIGLYLDKGLVKTLQDEGYTSLRYINGKAILNIALGNLEDAWFTTDEDINFRVFTTDPNAAGGVMVKVEAELASGTVIQPTSNITGVTLKGASDIQVSQNGVYDITK